MSKVTLRLSGGARTLTQVSMSTEPLVTISTQLSISKLKNTLGISLLDSTCGRWTSSFNFPWELVKNAESQDHPRSAESDIRICILTRALGISYTPSSLRSPALD